VLEQLDHLYGPVPNFRILTFSDGNINLNRVRLLGCQPDLKDMRGQSVCSFHSEQSFDFDSHRGSADRGSMAWQNEVLVIVGNRFGIKSVASEYFPAIKRYMKLPCFRGLVGGKPNFAYYFVGMVQKPTEQMEVGSESLDRLLYLDPHFVRPSSAQGSSCSEPRSIHMSQLDPCMSFGFLLRTEADFEQFSAAMEAGI